MLMNQGPNKEEINIEEKYNLKLPIKQLKELAASETKLDESEAFQNDTEKYMGMLTDSDKTLPDAARNILKRFLIRDVAVKLTSSRNSADKLNMTRDLPSFKKCLLGAMEKKKRVKIKKCKCINSLEPVSYKSH